MVVLTAAAPATAGLLAIKDVAHGIPILAEKVPADPTKPGKPQTILLLGSDRRYKERNDKHAARSDTIMLIRMDPSQEATTLLSIPRDLKTLIPGHGYEKINAAYSLGGPKLTLRTVRELLDIKVNHVINVNFSGFRKAVDLLGCVYTDVDRRYFHSNAGLPAAAQYAEIDIHPGYQKLCGAKALDYVRFRHADSDFVRAARQHDFLRQAKQQISVGEVFGDRKELLRIFGHYTQTDISSRNTPVILGLLKLAYESSKSPLTEIDFPATDSPDGSSVQIAPDALLDTVDRFIDVRGKDVVEDESAPKKPKRIRTRKGLAPGLVRAKEQGENHVL